MRTIEFKGHIYPHLQSEGFAAQFAFPFAQKVCKGVGIDVGCKKKEWCLPNAAPVDLELTGTNADNLPIENGTLDFIFSSHMLEHYEGSWVKVLKHWHSKLNLGGTLFLYLPDFSQVYWRPWHNQKHIHAFTPEIFKAYLQDNDNMWFNGFVTGTDLNNSFYVVCNKR